MGIVLIPIEQMKKLRLRAVIEFIQQVNVAAVSQGPDSMFLTIISGWGCGKKANKGPCRCLGTVWDEKMKDELGGCCYWETQVNEPLDKNQSSLVWPNVAEAFSSLCV